MDKMKKKEKKMAAFSLYMFVILSHDMQMRCFRLDIKSYFSETRWILDSNVRVASVVGSVSCSRVEF